jgi:hypothetical protein
MKEELLLEHIRNIYIKKPDEDVNFFIGHIWKHDLKKSGLKYEEITAKDLLNEMVNKRMTDVESIINALNQIKSEYKNNISENITSKRENPKQSEPLSYREYDMTDTHGNRLYSKGATVYLRLSKGEHRKLGVIDPKEKVFAIKRERLKHLFRKFNAYGFNHHFFSVPTTAFDKILLEDDYGKYVFPVKEIINENSTYLHFLGQKFERQVFLRLERMELFKQDNTLSVEGAEDEIVE